MKNEQDYVTLQVADGSSMAAYTSLPEKSTGKLPAIIVVQEAFGVNHHMRKVTDRFAKEGFVAICPEIFHRTAPVGFEGSYSDFASVMPHYQAVTIESLELDLKATYEWLVKQDNVDPNRVFSVGYCLGGKVSFLANAVLPLKAAVSYYGGGTDTIADKAADLHGKHLFFWGGLDKHIKSENIQTVISAMESAEKDYINVKISYADHAFACDDRPSYNETATKEAWALTLAFLSGS
jgi:carboxymethylenebutenolidase